MWLIDRLFNRKIEGKSSLDSLEPLVGKVVYEDGKIKVNADIEGKFYQEEIALTLSELFVEGTYGKVVISGNILMLIIAGSIPQQESSIGTLKLGEFIVPKGLRSKLHNITNSLGQPSQVLTQSVMALTSSGAYYVRGVRLTYNPTSGKVEIYGDLANFGTASNGVEFLSLRLPILLN